MASTTDAARKAARDAVEAARADMMARRPGMTGTLPVATRTRLVRQILDAYIPDNSDFEIIANPCGPDFNDSAFFTAPEPCTFQDEIGGILKADFGITLGYADDRDDGTYRCLINFLHIGQIRRSTEGDNDDEGADA